MKKLLVVLFFCATAMISQAQVNYVQGYFITSDGQRTEAYILLSSDDWRDNPKSFSYRIGDAGEARVADLSNIKELGLASGVVFHRLQVQMDRSSDDLNRMSENPQTSQLRSPVFATETLFLRLVLSGKATLYQYDEGNLHRSFYSVSDGEVKQLVYKRYMVRKEGVSQLDQTKGDLMVGVNEDYKQQLYNDLKCADVTMNDIQKLSYHVDKLKKIFTTFNKCAGGGSTTYEAKRQEKVLVKLYGKVGLSMNSITSGNVGLTGSGLSTSSSSSFRLGLEMEAVMPFGDGNWGVPLELSYLELESGSSLDVFLGIRRNIPAGNGGVFLSASAVLANPSAMTGWDSTLSFAVAGGFRANRFLAELNYGFPRMVVRTAGGTNVYETDFKNFAISVGYRITK